MSICVRQVCKSKPERPFSCIFWLLYLSQAKHEICIFNQSVHNRPTAVSFSANPPLVKLKPVPGNRIQRLSLRIRFREAAKQNFRFFLGDLSQMWVGGMVDSQTRSKPLKTFFDLNFTFRFPKSHISPRVGEWVGSYIWGNFPK